MRTATLLAPPRTTALLEMPTKAAVDVCAADSSALTALHAPFPASTLSLRTCNPQARTGPVNPSAIARALLARAVHAAPAPSGQNGFPQDMRALDAAAALPGAAAARSPQPAETPPAQVHGELKGAVYFACADDSGCLPWSAQLQ